MATELSFLVSRLSGQTHFTGGREDTCFSVARFYFRKLPCMGFVHKGLKGLTHLDQHRCYFSTFTYYMCWFYQ